MLSIIGHHIPSLIGGSTICGFLFTKMKVFKINVKVNTVFRMGVDWLKRRVVVVLNK